MQSEFTAYSKTKPSRLYRKKIDDIENRSFAVGNRSGAGKSLKGFQNMHQKMTYHPILLIPLCKK